MSKKIIRRSIPIEPGLWAEINKAVAVEMFRAGERMSASEWLRLAAVEKLERDKEES